MNEKSDLEKRTELFDDFCKKYPNYKPHVIKQAISNYDYDYMKIDEHLRKGSIGESPGAEPLRKCSNESGKTPMFSFVSMNSVNSEGSSSGIINKTYRTAMEINKITSQKTDLQKLDDAFKRLETHRDFLNREALYFGEVIERRKSIADFPNINEIEFWDKVVNKKYSMPAKSLSYANDLRQPSEMNMRYPGFHGIYNQHQNNNSQNMELSPPYVGEYLRRDHLNPNLFHSPQPIDRVLAPFKNADQKRYSAHFDKTPDFSQEISGNSQNRRGHHRQRSDPWILERKHTWLCQLCGTRNDDTSLCTHCEYNPLSK